jgi:hypothetical protein
MVMASGCAYAKTAPARSVAVLDARLALDSMGLAFATSLAGQGDVWFSREFLALIDPAPDDTATCLMPGPHDRESHHHEQLADTLEMWRVAHANGVTLGRFHWMGDKPSESAFEAQDRPGLLATFDALIHTLSTDFELGWSPFVTCGLQSLAIAASMSADLPVIFTSAKSQGEAPALCQDAEKAGIRCKELPPHSDMRADLRQSFSRALSLATLMGQPVAALWLVAPRSGLVARPEYPVEFVPERFRITLAECLPWHGAQIFWTVFSNGEEDAPQRTSH